jgi:four helix bundle protein
MTLVARCRLPVDLEKKNGGDSSMVRTEFENLRIYQLAEEIADLAWNVVGAWGHLGQETVGIQLIKSADSVGANIAEGSGRGSPAEKKRFVKIARGSLFEVKHWLRRAYKRQLLAGSEVKLFQKLIEELTLKLSAYINAIRKKSKDN